ncbi:MAG TPA: Hsp20/alpha crystallin family protein [Gaiellaceae bacterium]|nr:Hsp20/alpha crystallin family protein [Gaiellaceae bacterium]
MTERELSAAVRLAGELEPTAHVEDGDEVYRVEVTVPGLGERELDVEVADGLLRVHGPDLRRPAAETTFEFLFRLPPAVAADRLEASFSDGVLVVSAPKHAGRPRRLDLRP